MAIIKRFLPFLAWFEAYDLPTLRADFISGLTVALVLVPQSMAYAQLAGLPAYYGLYAAFLPPMVASLFGSSRQLATGPVAVVSLMTSAALEPLATAGSEPFIAYALLLALLVGIFQFSLGVLRLGLVVNFLSHPVVNGFTNAAAIIIATSQLSKIFGVYVDKAPHHYETIGRVIVAAVEYTHWPTLAMAVLSFATMIILRRVNPRIPNVLVAVVITTLLSSATGFQENETTTVARIGSDRVAELANSFNEAIRKKEALEAHRTESKKAWEGLEKSDLESCRRCHEEREIDRFGAGGGPREDDDRTPDRALVLHGMAGLLDRQIAALKRSISEVRTELRGFFFVRADEEEGGPRFFVRGEVPAGASVEKGTWRLRVGNVPLALDAITMTGGGAVVAKIPEGLPSLRLPSGNWAMAPRLFAAALIISLLGFMEAISIAKAMAARTRQKLDPNQELIGQGLANMVGCLGQSYAVSGSFSRSAVNLQAGARTGLSNVFSGIVVMIVLLFFAKWLYYLPQAVLASIIMMAVVGLLNVSGFMHAWRANRMDGLVSVLTFVSTLFFAPHLEWGILLGVTLSLGAYLYRSMRPHVVELVPDAQGTMRDAKRHGLGKCERLTVISFEGPLNFASASYLESEILNRVAEMQDLRHVLIAGNGISELDASGEETLRHLIDNLRGAGYEVSLSGVPETIVDVLKRSHLHDRIGEGSFFATRAQAIAAIYADAHRESEEPDCPYREVLPPVVELSLHPDGSLRDAQRHGLPLCRHIAAFRFDAPLTFANTAFMQEEILGRLSDRPGLRHVLFVSHGISDIDEAGARKLGDLVQRLRSDGLAAAFSGLKEDVSDVLARTQIDQVVGAENIYPTQVMAVAGIYARAHTGSSEEDCPLLGLAPHLTEVSLHHTGTLRDAKEHHLRLCANIGVVRFDGPLVFANRSAIQSEFIRWAKGRPNVRSLVFLMQTLPKFSVGETENLVALVEAVREAGYRAVFSNVSDRVFDVLARSGAVDVIGVEEIYPVDALAIAAVYPEAHGETPEEDCPLSGILPRVTELSLHPDGSLRNAHLHGLALCSRIAAVRFDGPLNYATIEYFEEELQSVLRRRPEARHVLIAGHTLHDLEPIAAEELPLMFRRLRDAGYAVSVSGLKDEVIAVLGGIAKLEAIGAHAIFPTQAKAIEAIRAQAHEGSDEETCPLVNVVSRGK